MNIIDITVDIETCSLRPNAAILQISALCWDRNGKDLEQVFCPAKKSNASFNAFVDLRSCLFEGMDFDPRTCKWWSERDDDVKSLIAGAATHPIREVVEKLSQWIVDMKGEKTTVCLWAQGSDFDIAILRHLFDRYGLPFPVNHVDFRDARTLILECGCKIFLSKNDDAIKDFCDVYAVLPKMEYSGITHDALYDAMLTSWNVWNCLKALEN